MLIPPRKFPSPLGGRAYLPVGRGVGEGEKE